jgi:aryl-alcohol dehydrogenase-like predicted oxidoreductase
MAETLVLAGKRFARLGLGCWVFDTQLWTAGQEKLLLDTMASAMEHGITHLDTASGYGDGASELVVGHFLGDDLAWQKQAFLATKADVAPSAREMIEKVRASLRRLRVESVDLYYIHWPNSHMDMRPAMEGLEQARRDGLIRSIGVSNFSPEQMEQVMEAGHIDAHQTGYNLFWRYREQDVIAFCREHEIPVITYGSIAQGILTGKFPRTLRLPADDQRNVIVFFREENWPLVWQAVEELKALAEQVGRPLHHLAIRWALARPGINAALVGARSPAQVIENAAALQGDIAPEVFEKMTAISDDLMKRLPDIGNMYAYYP